MLIMPFGAIINQQNIVHQKKEQQTFLSKKGKYSALNIANYIVVYYNRKGIRIDNLKLQKVLYYLQAQFMVSYNKPLFNEPIRAWDVGPIVDIVYYNFHRFGSASIFYGDGSRYPYSISSSDIELINNMLDELAPYSSPQLLDIIHNQSPWKNAYRNRRDISIYELRDYFKD